MQHKIDLFAAGFKYNAAAGISLADSRKAFAQYHSNLETLHSIEEKAVAKLGPEYADYIRSTSGVHGIIVRGSVRLYTLGSISRGIPRKEWEIPIPAVDLACYSFHPPADIIAFVDWSCVPLLMWPFS